MNPREEILGRIATALATEQPPERAVTPHEPAQIPHEPAQIPHEPAQIPHRPTGIPRGYRTTGTLDGPALRELLTERLRDYGAEVHPCDPGSLRSTVTALLDGRGVRDLVLPPVSPVDLTGWTGRRLSDTPGAALTPAELDAADSVLTGCAVAVAETGTIVLDAGSDQGRRALTLVPDHHLVVVRAEQIVQTIPEAVDRLDAVRPLTWISGPSATSDIELNRVEGVHGPRTLDVVLVSGTPR